MAIASTRSCSCSFEIGNLGFLLGEGGAEAHRVREHHALVIAAAQLYPERERAAQDHEHEARD